MSMTLSIREVLGLRTWIYTLALPKRNQKIFLVGYVPDPFPQIQFNITSNLLENIRLAEWLKK
jgi:hypothetical protein